MKRNRLLSALLAVMMVISMIACIALPAVADDAYTLTQTEAEALPSVSTATMDDGVRSYKIASWADMIYFASQDRYQTTTAYQESEYAASNGQAAAKKPYFYGTAQINDGSGQKAMGKVEYTNPAFVDQGRFNRTDVSTFDRVYLTVDLNVADYVGESGTGLTAFQADFDHFLAPSAASGYANSSMDLIFDGLGHTITGYEDTDAFVMGQWTGIFRNITFKNMNVNSAATYGSAIIKAFNDGIGNTVDNVHVLDSVYANSTVSVGGVIVGLTNNNFRPVQIKNCSVQNTRIVATNTGNLQFAGMLIGLQYGPSSPGASACVQSFENCLVANCSITGPTFRNDKDVGGILFGKYGGGSLGALKLDNIAVYNCSINATTATAANPLASVLGYSYGTSSTAEANNIGNIFAAKVTQSYVGANGIVTEPVSQFVIDRGSSWSSLAAVLDGNYVSDGTIPGGMKSATADYNTTATVAPEGADYNLLNMIADMNASSEYSDWGLDENGNVVLLASGATAPKIVTFEKDGAIATYATNAEGKLAYTLNEAGKVVAADAGAIAALSADTWVLTGGAEVAAGTDWSTKVFAADEAYALYSHEFSYVGNGDKTHNVTCSGCTEHAATNVPCTPVADPENNVAAGFFNKAETAYKCEFCSNTWTEEDVDSTFKAPFAVAFDAETYKNNGAPVVVTVTPDAEAAMSGLNLKVTYPANLEYVGASESSTAVVNKTAEGTLLIAMVKADGTTFGAADAVALNFAVKGLGASLMEADLDVTVEAIMITTGSGNDFAVKEALTKAVTAEATASYIDFVAGDVNGDEAADLLDAVLMIQKLNGTIGTTQDAAFKLIASDVNADGEFNVADVTLVLQYVCEMDVTLIPAGQEPTFVAVA